MRTRTALLLLLLTINLFSITHTVSLDGSQDYTVIQSAINASANGDTVLVYPGIYYENIVVNDKFITLASLNLTTGEEQYIHNTILDGNFSGTVIWMELITIPQPSDVRIQGFTVMHGNGSILNSFWPFYGSGGIFIACPDPDIWTDIYISNCQIKYNIADSGAGLELIYYGNYHMKNVSVHHNTARSGVGGISVSKGGFYHYPDSPCSYYANEGAPGHDINISSATLNTTIYADTLTCAEYDQGFIKISPPQGGETPELTVYHEHDYLEVIDHDLYVSPDGDDDNSGLSQDDPYQTIWKAAYMIRSNPDNPRTIHLVPGLYSDEDGSQRFTIGMKDHVSIVGSGMDETFLECTNAKEIISIYNNHDIKISGMSLKSNFPVHQDNLIWSPCPIEGVYIEDCVVKDIRVHDSVLGRLPAFQLWHTDRLTMDNIIIEDNVSELNCGMSLVAEDVTITDCVIRNNRSVQYNHIYSAYSAFSWNIEGSCLIDGLIVMNNVNECDFEDHKPGHIIHGNGYPGSDLKFTNSLFCDNVSLSDECFYIKHYAGSIDFINCTFVGNQSTARMINFQRRTETNPCDPLQLINCVFWDDAPYEIMNGSLYRCAIEVDHSLIKNGIDGIYSPFDEIIWGEGNLDLDPMLTDAEQLYYPQEDSPLINAGTPDTTGLGLPPLDLCDRARVWDGCIDIGCHEYGSEDTEPEEQVLPYEASLANYPNPFNPWTIVRYDLPETCAVRIDIYNVRGQLVRTLVDERQSAGEHEVVWDGRNEHSAIVASGVYMCRMTIEGKQITRKMIMLK